MAALLSAFISIYRHLHAILATATSEAMPSFVTYLFFHLLNLQLVHLSFLAQKHFTTLKLNSSLVQ